MVRLVLVAMLFALPVGTLQAREPEKAAPPPPPSTARPVAHAPGGDLRRDIERISSEIYRPVPPVREPKKR